MLTNKDKALSYYKSIATQNGRYSTHWETPEWVPGRLIMNRTIRSEIPGSRLIAFGGTEYPAESNKWGAVSAITDSGVLGLRPGEYETLEWVRNPYLETADDHQ